MTEPLPESLATLTGIGKEKILALQWLRQMGLIHSGDEPMRKPGGALVSADAVLAVLNHSARRVLGREPAPTERRWN